MDPPIPRFDLGQVVATPGALEALRQSQTDPASLLARHRRADFGQLNVSDIHGQLRALANEADPNQRQRMMSVYPIGNNVVIWIITEADRSSTCLLLPQEY